MNKQVLQFVLEIIISKHPYMGKICKVNKLFVKYKFEPRLHISSPKRFGFSQICKVNKLYVKYKFEPRLHISSPKLFQFIF